MSDAVTTEKNDFIRNMIREDVSAQKYPQIVTRFPPEPNGYLHLGHVKSICLNFGVAEEFGGVCNLRFDDTNPTAEKQDYIDNIKNDVKWLGFDWQGKHIMRQVTLISSTLGQFSLSSKAMRM